MIAQFKKKNIFGRHMLYPENDAAQEICKILGSKTMPTQYIYNFTNLGVEIHVSGDKPEIHKAQS